jgi:hypothetical protein
MREGDYTFFFGKGKEIHKFGRGYFVHHKIVSE